MDRLVFELAPAIGPDNAVYVAISLEEPPVFGSAGHPFRCSGNEAPFAALKKVVLGDDAVKQAGRYLFEAVAKHPEVCAQLIEALKKRQPDRCPVFVSIATPSGIEALPWETLCSPDGDFLGLDERWAVGRMVAGEWSGSAWPFAPPLRVAAVLSCLDVPAAQEWLALRAAIESAPGLEVTLLVVVSEPDLYDEIEQAITDGLANVEVAMVPEDLEDLQGLVRHFRPEILHLFCHGSSRGGPHIELAAKTDRESSVAKSSLTVEAREIRNFTGPTEVPWLVVLNCCESADAGDVEDLPSFSLRLLYDVGIPAVVGMREPVASDDASLFTETFYRRLVEDFSARLGSGAAVDDPVDWTRFVVDARMRLAKKYKTCTLTEAASSTKEWTLPAIYVRPQPFVLLSKTTPGSDEAADAPPSDERPDSQVVDQMPAPASDEAPDPKSAQLQIELFEGLLQRLPPDRPPDLLTDIELQLDALRYQLGQ